MTEETQTEPVLAIAEVRLAFGGVQALDGPSLTVGRGEVVGLIGPNGAGKTSLFNCVSGLYRPQSGSIRVGGTEVIGLPRHRIVGLGVGRTFQNLGLLPSQSVRENVMAGTFHLTRTGYAGTVLAVPRAGREERRSAAAADEVIDALGLGAVASQPVAALPFGTAKRVELARALVGAPRLLLVDEPANGLVHSEVAELGATVRALARDRGAAVLLVEHHMAMVMSTCDRVVAMSFGRVIAHGVPHVVAEHPEVVAAYLGRRAG